MKSIIYILMILICGCAVMKKHTAGYAVGGQYLQEELRHTMLFRGQDSGARYWYFETDSLFYFHPDSGLYGFSGALWSGGSRKKELLVLESTDSLYRQSRTMSAEWGEAISKRGGRYTVLAIVVLLLVVILWFWMRRFED